MSDIEGIDPFESPAEPLAEEEMGEEGAAEEIEESILAGNLTTAGKLLEKMEEVPPPPPRVAPLQGPNPPGDLRFDFDWERQVIPFDAGDAMRERIVDPSSLVPTPLSPEALAEWEKFQAVWLHWRKEGGQQDYDYLFRKGHLGAVTHVYTSDPASPRFKSAAELRDLFVRLGFPSDVANREASRRHKAITARAAAPPQSGLELGEREHLRKQEAAQKAFLAAMKKKK